VSREIADIVTPEAIAKLQPHFEEGQKIMVAVRGITPALRFAMDEAQLRKATLLVLYVKEIAVFFPGSVPTVGRAKWKDDPEASAIMLLVQNIGRERGISVVPVYATSADAPTTILDLSATLGIEFLILGASHRMGLASLLKGNVIERVAAGLPEDIQLVIHG
jgi:nucleotide-binding universal stress UspA family protein